MNNHNPAEGAKGAIKHEERDAYKGEDPAMEEDFSAEQGVREMRA